MEAKGVEQRINDRIEKYGKMGFWEEFTEEPEVSGQ
jgi:hypothetical protein